MPDGPGYHNRQPALAAKICSLLSSLYPSTYNEIAPKIEYWIEYGITEQFTTTDDLAERVSPVAWSVGSYSDISRFLKEFRDAPHRSESMRSFVDQLCTRVLRWFAIAAAEDLSASSIANASSTANGGWSGFARAASFVGHLIECGLLGHDIVRRHLIKPLLAHHDYDHYRARAIYELFAVPGNALLQGLLEPGDVQVCFERLDMLGNIFHQHHSQFGDCLAYCQIFCTLSGAGGLQSVEEGVELYKAKLNELREIHAAWLRRREEEEQGDVAETEQEDVTAADTPAEVEAPVAFIPQGLPTAAIDITTPSPIVQPIEPPSILRDVGPLPETFPETFIEIPTGTPSPTFTISTISDLTTPELDEDIGDDGGERVAARHDTFYFEDGNVEVVCGDTLFRVHSTVVSFSSPKLRDMLSPSTLLNAPMPEGRPRIIAKDSSEDFAVLLKMIYTPGFPARHRVPEFTVFASLLRMATKYGFSDVREQLVEDLKGAYPTNWEAYQAAEVLGENVFGSPKPHPNSVLNLFAEQGIRPALPFAAYRAALGGYSSLISDRPGTVLPRVTLASTIYGMERIRGVLARVAYSIVSDVSPVVCPQRACVLNAGINPAERRREALDKIFGVMVDQSKGDVLSPLSFGDLVCVNCARQLEDAHLRYREHSVWVALPGLLRGRWEDV